MIYMSIPRRFLPPMSELVAFEAAARLQSFTEAAAECHLTQSAISRQIRALEDQLGSPLFLRERQTVKLTLAGEAYAHEIRAALRRIGAATLTFRANPNGGKLNLAILPTFGARWLTPRLPDFMARHPGITINLTTKLSQFDFEIESVDAAIHFGLPDWPGADHALLMSETVVPVCNAAMAKALQLVRPADLLKAPLLHLVTRPDAWEKWFQAMDVPFTDVHGMLVDQFALASEAAIAGVGVALLPRFLIEAELARGELLIPIDHPVESEERYYLTWPSSRASHPPLLTFRGWLQGQLNPQPPGLQ